MLKPALARWPESYPLQLELGWACAQFECLEDAEAAYRRAIVLRPDRFPAYNLLAWTLIRMFRPGEALECARASMRLDPLNGAAYIAALDAARLSGDAPAALEYARQSARLCLPGEHRIARVLLSYERWPEAEGLLRRARAAHPGHSDTPMYLALALIPQGRLDEAAYSLRDALRIWPRYTLAELILLRVSTWWREERGLRETLEAEPLDGAALGNLAALLLAQGRLDEAIATFEAAVRAPPPGPVDDTLRLARAHRAALDRGEAVADSAMLALELEMRGVIDERRRRRGKRA